MEYNIIYKMRRPKLVTNNDKNLVTCIVAYIKSDAVLHSRYYAATCHRKYDFAVMLEIIVHVLRYGVPWRSVSNLKLAGNIHWSTIYKTYCKLVNDNVLRACYEKVLEMYFKDKPMTKLKHQYTDTSVIANKYGCDKVGRNKYYKNKKITKLSIITDEQGIPISVKLDAGNIHDSKIMTEQLNDKHCHLIKVLQPRNKIMMADKGYDSKPLKKLLKENGYTTIIPQNRRNIKDKKKIHKMRPQEKRLYRKRIRVENTFMKLKKNRRLDVRYDKMVKMYEGFVFLGMIDMVLRIWTKLIV